MRAPTFIETIGGFAILALVTVAFVDLPDTEYSETLYEAGTVVETLHTNADSHMGIGFTTGGNVAFNSTSVPETWGVVFRCDHGNKFAIQGSGIEHQILWEQLDTGMNVSIAYREEYSVKDDVRTLVDFDFIDAEQIK